MYHETNTLNCDAFKVQVLFLCFIFLFRNVLCEPSLTGLLSAVESFMGHHIVQTIRFPLVSTKEQLRTRRPAVDYAAVAGESSRSLKVKCTSVFGSILT